MDYFRKVAEPVVAQFFEGLKSLPSTGSVVRANDTVGTSSTFEEKLLDLLVNLDRHFSAGLISKEDRTVITMKIMKKCSRNSIVIFIPRSCLMFKSPGTNQKTKCHT